MRPNYFCQYLQRRLKFSFALISHLTEALGYSLGERPRGPQATVWMSPKSEWIKYPVCFQLAFSFLPHAIAFRGPQNPWRVLVGTGSTKFKHLRSDGSKGPSRVGQRRQEVGAWKGTDRRVQRSWRKWRRKERTQWEGRGLRGSSLGGIVSFSRKYHTEVPHYPQ